MKAEAPSWMRWARWIVGLGLLVALVGLTGPEELASTFASVKVGGAVLTVALCSLWLLLGALNVWILLRCVSRIGFSTFVPIYGASWAASQLLPSQFGDATQVLLLRQHNVKIEQSGAVYLTDKAISISWLFMVAATGVGLYLPGVHGWWLAAPPLIVATVASASVWALLRLRTRRGSLTNKLQDSVSRTVRELIGMRRHRASVALNCALTLFRWMVNTSYYVVAFWAFGFELPLAAAATIPVMSSIVGYIPVTAGGAGTSEWTAVFIFSQVGVPAAIVVSVYLFLRVVLLMIALLLLLLPRLRRGNSQSH